MSEFGFISWTTMPEGPQGKGTALAGCAKVLKTKGEGIVLATKAVETQGHGTLLATVETQAKGSVSPMV